MVLKFLHLELVKVTRGTRWNSLIFVFVYLYSRSKRLVGHGFQVHVLVLGLKVQWFKILDGFLLYTVNIMHKYAPADLCRFHERKISIFTVYRLCYWSHRYVRLITYISHFSALWKFYSLLKRAVILCISRTTKTLFKTMGSRKLSIERQNWFSFTASKVSFVCTAVLILMSQLAVAIQIISLPFIWL